MIKIFVPAQGELLALGGFFKPGLGEFSWDELLLLLLRLTMDGRYIRVICNRNDIKWLERYLCGFQTWVYANTSLRL